MLSDNNKIAIVISAILATRVVLVLDTITLLHTYTGILACVRWPTYRNMMFLLIWNRTNPRSYSGMNGSIPTRASSRYESHTLSARFGRQPCQGCARFSMLVQPLLELLIRLVIDNLCQHFQVTTYQLPLSY